MDDQMKTKMKWSNQKKRKNNYDDDDNGKKFQSIIDIKIHNIIQWKNGQMIELLNKKKTNKQTNNLPR